MIAETFAIGGARALAERLVIELEHAHRAALDAARPENANQILTLLEDVREQMLGAGALAEAITPSHYTHLSETQPAPRQVVDLKGLIQVAGDMSGLFVSL